MRSLFWRIFATFWLAIAVVAGLSLLLGHALKQDDWILARHPGLKTLAREWSERFETQGALAGQQYLEQHRQRWRINVQVLDELGEPLVRGTFPARAAAFEARARHQERLPWRRLTEEYQGPGSAETYLFIYRIPLSELASWQRDSLLWPASALGIALVVLTLCSLLLTFSITGPLGRLRRAVHDLGQTSYQQDSLARLATRRDELGTLACDFNRMGARLQGLITSQRQLLHDVSHELRSPLARLRIALALAERAGAEERARLWPRLAQECDRLEGLISEILTLARVDSETRPREHIALAALLHKLCEDARLLAPQQHIALSVTDELSLQGWPPLLERALDNLLRNALRFNPPGQPLEVSAECHGAQLAIRVRDHGPGVASEHLSRLGEPFFRAPGQSSSGHGLGLAIARRAAQRHGGQLQLANHPEGGFVATLQLPVTTASD
ncbi:HAMP domain-containing sensor histidine kinase [Pseudomonas sp. NW5]|uniref:sensor histidine kinase n=1 Tax=Pseudomonas sp. NW5 TaxID=2934934 RepID=UPI0020214370|nr:HAMP domain-containing sensor histidine kinase [Pseudomonas sp. NW5]MCL7462057.1 HAMP domain-containing histidine kinase [Pseudomonas sp. NW5]